MPSVTAPIRRAGLRPRPPTPRPRRASPAPGPATSPSARRSAAPARIDASSVSSARCGRADGRGVHRGPYADYAELRERAPVLYDEATDHWLVSRYADVDALLRDRRFGRTYLHVASHDEMGRPPPPEWHDPFWDLINAGILDMERA